MLSPQTPGEHARLKGTRSGSFWLSQQPSKKANDYANALYKTELCRSFNEAGYCRYGLKCRFAHGMEDLRPVSRHKKYKTEPCKNYSRDGVCPYGNRCRFVHEDDPPEMARARSASFSSPGSPSVSPSPSSSALMDLARLGDFDGKQNYGSSRQNRARSVSFHSLYSTSSTPSLSEKESEKETEKTKMPEKDEDLSYARMGGQPPQGQNLLSGKSAEPFVSELPTSYRYYDDHSPVSVSVSGISSLSPSISQSSLKSSQQPAVISPPSPSPTSSFPIAIPTRQVFQPTPFKSVVGFAPSGSLAPRNTSGWNPIESDSMDLSRLVEKEKKDTSVRGLAVSISSLSLSLAKSPPKPSSSPWSSSLSTPSSSPPVSSDPVPSLSKTPLAAQESKAQDIFLPPSFTRAKSTDSTDSGPVVIAPLDSPSTGAPLPSPNVPELSLDLFEAGPSNRLPIFATLTLSPKKVKA